MQTSADLDRFRHEVVLLSRLDHPNVVSLVGARVLPPDYMMVLKRGQDDLREMLYEQAWRPTWDTIIR